MKKIYLAISTTVVALLLSACGGGGGSASFSDAQTLITIVDCNTSTFTPIQTDDVLVKDTEITKVTIVHDSNNTKKVCVDLGSAHLVRE